MIPGDPGAGSLPTIEMPAGQRPHNPEFQSSGNSHDQAAVVDARAVLAEHPEWADKKSIVLDLAYEEYCQRREAGAAIDPDEFCGRFPTYRSSLQRLLGVHQFLQENPHLLTTPGADIWPAPGQTFLGYSLIRQLGRGSFARVFLATEPALGGRQVALKVSRLGADEARTLGKLNHPNVVPINTALTDPVTRLSVICMPYLGSATLCDVLDRVLAGAAPESAGVFDEALQAPVDDTSAASRRRFRGTYVDGVLRIGVQLAGALAFVHGLGICHRDLKPSNVLLADDGRPMLLDFNLSFDRQTADNRLGGTLAYMPPEQLLATDPGSKGDPALVDGRSDIFSLGIILYELLAGRHPFGPLSAKMSSQQVRHWLLEKQRGRVLDLRLANPRVDYKLARLVERCLAYEPADRPQSPSELATGLRRALSWRRRTARWGARHRRRVAAVVGVLAVMAGLTVYAFAQRPPYSVREFQAGLATYRQGDYQGAVERFNRSLAAAPGSADVLFARGRAHQQFGALDLALADYHAAARIADEGTTHACIGYCQARLGMPDGASLHLAMAIERGYAPAEVWSNLGYCHQVRARMEDAKTALDRALELKPDLRPALHTRAVVALQMSLAKGQGAATGVADIRRALEPGPVTTDMLRLAANLHAEAGDKESALKYLKQAIENGQDPKPLAKDGGLRRVRNDAAFQELLRTVKPQGTPSHSMRLVDPIPDTSAVR